MACLGFGCCFDTLSRLDLWSFGEFFGDVTTLLADDFHVFFAGVVWVFETLDCLGIYWETWETGGWGVREKGHDGRGLSDPIIQESPSDT